MYVGFKILLDVDGCYPSQPNNLTTHSLPRLFDLAGRAVVLDDRIERVPGLAQRLLHLARERHALAGHEHALAAVVLAWDLEQLGLWLHCCELLANALGAFAQHLTPQTSLGQCAYGLGAIVVVGGICRRRLDLGVVAILLVVVGFRAARARDLFHGPCRDLLRGHKAAWNWCHHGCLVGGESWLGVCAREEIGE